MSEWISVSERLPEPGVPVLIYIPAHDEQVTGVLERADGILASDSFHVNECDYWPVEHVSHWQPLPPPPSTPC